MIFEFIKIYFLFSTLFCNSTAIREIQYIRIKEGTSLILKTDVDLTKYDTIIWFKVDSVGADELTLASIVSQEVTIWKTPKEQRIKIITEGNRITFNLENFESSDEGFYRFERLPMDHNGSVYKVTLAAISTERSTSSSEKILLPLIICVTIVLVISIIALTIMCFLKAKRQRPQEDNISNSLQLTVSPTTPTSSGVFSTELSNSNGFSSLSSTRMTPLQHFDEIPPSIV